MRKGCQYPQEYVLHISGAAGECAVAEATGRLSTDCFLSGTLPSRVVTSQAAGIMARVRTDPKHRISDHHDTYATGRTG
jgi:hypothetical protein